MAKRETSAAPGTSIDDVAEAGGVTSTSALYSNEPRSNYEVRYDALQFAIDTYSDNRSRGEDDIIRAAREYEVFLKEVQNN